MKMKKKLLGLFPLLFLVGCAQAEPVAESYRISYQGKFPTVHLDASDHVTYLMLTRYGRLDLGGELIEGDVIPGTYYENCVAYEGAAGSALPKAVFTRNGVVQEDVTFRGWYHYNGNIYPEKYESVPTEDVMQLMAIFDGPTGGSGGSGGGGGGSDVNSGYGFAFSDGSKVKGTYVGDTTEDGVTYSQYKITGQAFTEGQKFSLYDFGQDASWTIALNPWSFGDKQGTGQYWKTYLSMDTSAYTVKQSFTADIYIKLSFGNDNVYFELK